MKKKKKKGCIQPNGKLKHYATQEVNAENGLFTPFPFAQW